ncbi:Ubiquitin carboxyl-terminal hydrolase 2 [Lecanosticta acicola]|uniref:ubiquitinyl hydrolase 1 n=1 Tax=Lecanosticta acicola TaxID=111012 RepID=A0AAI9EA05_9PEZI|nr:Ubiquitin carboxyl-terminal hydrolase 2 [Lecanosticta acicola]
MPSIPSGPGKTAPKLVQDFLLFDPLRTAQGQNYLTDFSPTVGDGPQLAPVIGSCKHEYRTKHEQSVLPPLDLRPDGGSEYKCAVICKKCRIHADVHIHFASASNPCPNHDYPLHHFQRVHAEDYQSTNRLSYVWQCSGPACGAQLRITFRMPRISPQQKVMLTDTELLKRRYEAVMKEDTNRDNVRRATPVESLTRLRKYIKDSLDPKHTRRTFSAYNKRFMEAFGVYGRDCADILNELGFRHGVDDEGSEIWTLPQPGVLDDRLRADGTHLRELLEDVELELEVLMAKLAHETGAVNPAAAEGGWTSADKDIERTLAVQGYARHSSLRRVGASNEELPYFSALGALPDFADSLLVFSFDRQVLCDPEKRAYYFECLQTITDGRNTEQLQMKVATLNSQGEISRRDLSAAFRTLNIPVSEHQASDERILNLFHVRILDLGSQAEAEARQALYKIGVARNSQQLIGTAQRAMETYEEALGWLGNGAEKTTDDEFLISIASIKKNEGKENEELTMKAISIIARERKSDMLNNWVVSGEVGEYQMSVDEALRHLGIDGKFEECDPEILPLLFDTARSDKPGENTEKAIATLQQAMAGGPPKPSHSLDTWPVGLISHGNTCYLNSLLQYYFSMAPFREHILNYDEHKYDIAKYGEKKQRVGYVFVDTVQIKGSHVFAEDLKHLFERMIKEPSISVKPEQDLVCRAFLELKDYALLTADQDEEEGDGASHRDVEAAVEQKIPDGPAVPAPADEQSRHQSDASSTTLQASVNGEDTDVSMQSNEQRPPTPPASPGTEAADKKQQPAAAPPLPPRKRKQSSAREKALALAQEKARQQQDVTEVHDAIMDRLRFGLMPLGEEEGGEQEDALRNLFRITISETRVKGELDEKPRNQFTTAIQVDVPSEPMDIYSALDSFFDLQTFEIDPKTGPRTAFKSIVSPPPVLQISIPRIGFDSVKGESHKIEQSVKLEDELYLDRYIDNSGVDILPKRKACFGWRKQLRTLKKEQKALSQSEMELDGPAAVTETANYINNLNGIDSELEEVGLDGLEVDSELPGILQQDAAQQAERLAVLEREIAQLETQLQNQFTDAKRVKYRLASVFFHRGTVGHGHYWVYIHDFENDMWRKYNDDQVEQFTDIKEILEAHTWAHGTPMYAVYVQDDKKTEIIKPVCRAPEQLPTPAYSSNEQGSNGWVDDVGNDVDMKDANESDIANPRTTMKQSSGVPESTAGWDTPRHVPPTAW